MRYFFRVEYDGTDYHGWQRQPNGMSVQEALEGAFAIVTRGRCVVVGGGRTDAGVHARRQGAHVDLDGEVDTGQLQRSVNGVLPPDIAIASLQPVADDFHARFSAAERRYRYTVVQHKSPLNRRTAWVHSYAVDWDRVARETAVLVGEHDFATFCAAGSESETTICRVSRAELVACENQWVFFVCANRFLYRMVRSLVGTLTDIGRGARGDSMAHILGSRERAAAGPTAPACGLLLDDVIYPGVVD